MRLLALTTSYPLGRDSVSGIFVARLIEHLPPHVSVTVVTPDVAQRVAPSGSPRVTVYPFRYAVRSLQVLAHGPGGIPATLRAHQWTFLLVPGFLLSMFVTCLRHARRADVIHANWAICGCVAGAVGRLLNVPVVTTLRGSDIARAQTSLLDRYILRWCARWSNRVVAVSRSIEAVVRRDYPQHASKVCTIENGVDDSFFAVYDKRGARNARSSLRVLTIGNLTPNKNVERIIHAFHRLPEGRATLTIVGDGTERERLTACAQALELKDRVEFLGQLTPDRVREELSKADVFVLASRSEGRPNVILEAMAAGLPVVASDIPGVDELVAQERTGFRFQPDNADELFRYLQRLMDDPALRAELGQAGRAWMLNQRLTWNRTADAYCELYANVLKTRSCAA